MSVIKSRRGQSLLAVAGATAGLASILIPSSAQAAPGTSDDANLFTDSVQGGTAAAALAGPSPQLANCTSWNDFHNAIGEVIHVPSIGREGSINCELGRNNVSDAVTKLQDALNQCNGQNLVKDGNYGINTEKAVRAVQDAKHIPIDGRYGPQTRDAMLWPAYSPNGTFVCRDATFI